MAELQRNFLQGIMNKDLDPHFLPDGQYRDALNIIVADSDGTFSTTDGQHNGVVQNYLGNIQMNSSLGLQPDALCIGAISVPAQNTIYWFVTSSDFDAIFEYNEEFDTTDVVLKSTKNGSNVLNFNPNYRITGVNYINGLLFWTDNYNPPRKINIERCKNYAEDGFTEDDISVIVKPPIASPVIALSNDTATTANNLENKFIYFAYRYKYLDDEYSSLSPFSPVAFFPKPFAYDYGVSENISMVNSKNTATISYNTGGANVKEVQLIYIDTLSTNAYIIDNINKQANNFTDNATETFVFQNNKVYTVLPADQVNRLFDNVPLKAQAQDLIGSRLIYGNYTQFFNLVDSNGADIKPAFSLALEGSLITDNNPHPTFKSNRDYEIGIVYLDDYGRSTTVITPTLNTNTLYIPADRANYTNDIRIEIDKDYAPPAFATYYRFVIKQNKQEYYNVFPLTYFSDGQFKWFLINQSDVDKISIGSYLYLKNSTNNNLNTQFKVLDIVSKSANFLNNTKQQPAGVYFKVKIDDNILPALYYYNFTNIGERVPGLFIRPIIDSFSVAEKAIFYGIGDGGNMVTSNSNIYTGVNDIRFKVEISAANKFKYYAFLLGTPYTYVNEVTITPGVNQTLSYTYNSITYSCVIKFNTTSGLNLKDYWVINCRSNGGKNIFGGPTITGVTSQNPPFGWATGTNWNVNGSWNSDRAIEAGATLSFKSKEPKNGNVDVTNTFISTKRYVNIEEWFIEDGAYKSWSQYEGELSIGAKNICFRRVGAFQETQYDYYDANQGGSISDTSLLYPVFMLIYGYIPPNTANETVALEVTFDFQESLSPVLFETVPTDNNQDIYYELTNTYPIVNGSHYTNFTNQVLGQSSGYAYLNRSDSFLYPNYDFNAFAWSNGVESFRIRDDWNAATMQFSPRANSTVEGYAEQTLVQALTFSGVYQQTTAINRLNEFNLSLGNFKYLDRFFGSIQKLHARDTDLVVFQENKVSKVLYGKNLLSDSIGGGTIASIPEVLGTQIAYTGEYGISENPESFATWGNNMYFTDARRGAVMQLSEAGLFEISSNGMKNWFKNNLNPSTIKLGMLDPYFEHYVLSSNDERPINPCQLSVSSDNVVVSYIANNNQFAFAIESNTQWSISVPTNDWITLNTLYGVGSAQILATTTETEDARSITVVVSGCNTTINVIISQASAPPVYPTTWYSLRRCSDNTNHWSQGYQSPVFFSPNERVTSGGSTYIVLQGYSENPGGTQLPITSTGQLFCPSVPPTQEWYTLVNCSTSATATSIAYSINTFAIDARVTSGGNTYRVSAKTTTNPGGTQISITSTGLTGCPPAPQEWYRLYNCTDGSNNRFSISYAPGTYLVGERVTSGVLTYTISEVTSVQPVGNLLTLTSTGQVGCPTAVTYYLLAGDNSTIGTKWYRLYNCSTGATAYSIGYPETIVFNINDRVTSGGVNYTIADIYSVSTGTNQIAITATGIVGCPTTAQEWYYLTNCSTGATAYSIAYPPNTFPVNRRVTNLNDTYVVTSILPSDPGGTQLTLTDAFVSGCPEIYPTTWYTLRRCSDNAQRWSQGYQSPTFFSPNERVTSGGSTYVVLQGYTEDPGGTQLPITSTGQFFCPSTPTTQEWYTIVKCSDGTSANTIGYNIGSFGLNDRVTVGTDIYRIGSVLTTNPGGTQLNISSTGLTGCPSTNQEWYKLYICDTGQIRYSTAYDIGSFVLNERVLTDTDFIATIYEVLSVEPSFNKVGISYTGFFNCP
jgi:hypothetical protein